MIKKEFSN